MIGKIVKGSDFHGLMAYLMRDGRGEILEFHNLSATIPHEVAGEMSIAALMSRRAKKPVLHCSLSYAHDENPTEDQIRADALKALKGLCLEHHQAIVVRHRDKGHTHIHIAANRIGLDGRAAHDGHSYAKLETVLRSIEHERGWQSVLGRNASDHNGLRMAGHAKRPDPRQAQVPDTVRAILLEARSWRDLHAGLASEGWRLEIRQRTGQKSGALLLGPNGEKIAAGKIDRSVTLSRLNLRLSPRTIASLKTAPLNRKKALRMTRNTERSLEILVNGLIAAMSSTASLSRRKPILTPPFPRRRGTMIRITTPSMSHLPRTR